MMELPPFDEGAPKAEERLALLDRFDGLLELRHYSASLGNFTDPLDEVSYILLGRQDREVGYQRARCTVRSRWPSWAEPMNAPQSDVIDIMRPAGFGNTRAVQLQGLLYAVALISFCPTGRERQAAPAGRPVAVKLFAGGVVLSEAVAVAAELNRDAAQTYRANHPGTVVIEANATKVLAADLNRLASAAATPAANIAGPPCQGYSASRKRDVLDARNTLYKSVVSLAQETQSKFVAIENVSGMRSVGGREYVGVVIDDLDGTGYGASASLLRAADFGVPQPRRRLLFLAQRQQDVPAPDVLAPTRCSGSFCASKCSEDPRSQGGLPVTPAALQALSGSPPLEAGTEAEYPPGASAGRALLNGTTMLHSDRVVAKIHAITAGSGPIFYCRLRRDLARTLVAGQRAARVSDAGQDQVVREAARIQGFDDDHVFAGRKPGQPLQVANAVPFALDAAVARTLLAAALPIRSPPAARGPGLKPEVGLLSDLVPA